MKPTLRPGQGVMQWLGVAYLGLLPISPLSAQEPKLRDTLERPAGVACVAFSPDGKTLASGGDDGTIKLCDVATDKGQAITQGTQG